MVHVVIGIIINPQREVLIAQRLHHQEKGGCWEFPGGKVEHGESAFSALQRELNEELGIRITKAKSWMEVLHHYPNKSVRLDTWMVEEYEGEPHGAEGQPIRWIAFAELTTLEFPEGNREIIAKLLGE